MIYPKIYVELYNKASSEIELIPIRDFINPKSETAKETGLKPKGFQSATWMLCDMLNGQIYQNVSFAVGLEGRNPFSTWIEDKRNNL